jgi:hypothetical protein
MKREGECFQAYLQKEKKKPLEEILQIKGVWVRLRLSNEGNNIKARIKG